MKLRARILLSLLATAPLGAYAQDLPKHSPGDSLDFEPQLMLDGPRAPMFAASPTPSPEDRVQHCEAALLDAQQRAADSEQLLKEGILAKVEMEARLMRIVQIRKELADASLAVAEEHADSVRLALAAHKATQPDLAAADAALKTAQQAAADASSTWDQSQINAAALDLQRKRKLYSEGVGSRREVQMAEDRFALLSGTLP